MQKSILILLVGMLFYTTTYAQKYFGKTYQPTQNIDEYYDIADVTKAHTVMGKAELDKGFRSLEKTQAKIIELARKKGADGVIFSIEEEVYATSTSGGDVVNRKKEKKTTVSSNSTTMDLKEKTVKATFIKYK